jgi:ABC-type branched-subunit amino acid transport system substrate-binding protein
MTGARANRVCFRQTCSLAMLSTALGAELVRRAKRWYFLIADYAFGTDARDRLKTILLAHGGTIAALHKRFVAAANGFPPNWRQYLGYMAVANIVDRIEAAGTTDTETLVRAFENHRYDAAKAQPGYFRSCDHQAVQETFCAEMRRTAANSRPDRAPIRTAPRPRRSSARKKSRRATATRRWRCASRLCR